MRYRRARRRVRAARGRRPTISAGTAPGRSGCARSARRRSNTLPLGRFRSARRCRCTGVGYPRYSCPSSRRRSHRPPAPRRRRRDDRPHSYPGRHAPRRRPTSPAPADAATGPGSRDRSVRPTSNNSSSRCRRPAPASTRPRSAAAHTGRTAARSDPAPHRSHTATDRCLCCVPRRLRHHYFRQFSQTTKDAAVTAPTSANTPTTIDLRL